MGSKRYMLCNGLGDTITKLAPKSRRFIDLFSGSGAVSWFVAEQFPIPVVAVDLQLYSSVLADAILARTGPLEIRWVENWLQRAKAHAESSKGYQRAQQLQNTIAVGAVHSAATSARELCANSEYSICRAYGGYYYSALQSILIACLRQTLPSDPSRKRVALAALVQAASMCAAAPGHTAQPFKPNSSAGRFLLEAWRKDVLEIVAQRAKELSARFALVEGKSIVGDANILARELNVDDLVFLDPPYSAVHYSRFYHVLETIASGKDVEVSGEGRYPPQELRPHSSYSVGTKSLSAIEDLLATLGSRGCRVIITFPAGKASNGLSGELVTSAAEKYFKVDSATVHGRFSTLGGNAKIRSARQTSEELVLSLRPR
ncbi:MAG: hypothetical protein C0456_10715 [Hyphomonas sp.]|uniref:DNA adenine methylase n=1 Tax=Hyphomonas sp. TaxID=87 RepID=UPI001DE9F0FE|nr:DNA adenine methylase [Hyphomonas sp.]MBA4227091.1 hypothetical protein [Hyphomonas sp.]